MKSTTKFLLLFLISSCGGGGSSNSDNESVSPPDTNTNTESCENTSIDNLQKCDLKHDNLDRYYYIYIPENLDINSSIPVLLSLIHI